MIYRIDKIQKKIVLTYSDVLSRVGPVLQSLAWPPGPLGLVRVGPRAKVLWPCLWAVYAAHH